MLLVYSIDDVNTSNLPSSICMKFVIENPIKQYCSYKQT